MTARILDGRALAARVRDDLSERVDRLATGEPPRLAILGDGSSEAAEMYTASLERAGRDIGIGVELNVRGDLDVADVIELNHDPAVAGIVVATPLADPRRAQVLMDAIDPAKDVDGATATSAGRLARGDPAMVPATALAVIALLDAYDVAIGGRLAVVVGRSPVVGRPVAALLTARDATVVLAHRRTVDLAAETRRADLLIVAAGAARLIGPDMVQPSAVVVDCGINPLADGTVVGDVDFERVSPLVHAISPVPGGVGPVTPMMILRQLVEAAERRAAGEGRPVA